jgi:Na+-driven multidrug efflux pump
VSLVGKGVEKWTVRILLLQMLSHALIFCTQNAGSLAERVLLAADTAATAALGLSWTVFCLLYAFTANVVNVCPIVVARFAGDGDASGARAAASQAMLLACGGGAVGLALAVAAGAVAACAVGPARDQALFLATQGLALGPLLGARALTGYFAGTMTVGPGLLAAVTITPMAVHLTLTWLLTGPVSWSVAGVGLSRLGAALIAVAAALAVARAQFGGLGALVRRPDRALFRAMFTEGSVLGLQQVVASMMVLLLYLTAARAGDLTSAALTLTHSGVYPLLFAFAWGGSQAIAAAAAQALGNRDPAELACATRRCLGLSALLAFALPWGAFALFGTLTLAWVVGDTPGCSAVLAASLRFMGLLAVFFPFDFAINFLSALLRAAKEQAYLLRATTVAAAAFGLIVLALPRQPNDACLMGTFITVQAVWAGLLFLRVANRWPGAAVGSGPAASGLGRVVFGPPLGTTPAHPGLTTPLLATSPKGMNRDYEAAGVERLPARNGLIAFHNQPQGNGRGNASGLGAVKLPLIPTRWSNPRFPTLEEHAMDLPQPNTALLPPPLRALALSLLIETGVSLLNKWHQEGPVPPGQGGRYADGEGELWQKLRCKCGELSALVLQANQPGEAASYLLDYLPKHLDFVFEQVYGSKRRPVLANFEAVPTVRKSDRKPSNA